MQFEHEGRALWYGTPDALTPEQVVRAGTEITITVGVRPVDSSNRVELLYRVNQGPIETVSAKWLRTDPSSKAQYFRVRLPDFRAGDIVQYIPICVCAGRQVPSPEEAQQFVASFRVTEGPVRAPGLREKEPPLLRPDKPIRTRESASPSTAAPKPPGASSRPTPVPASRETALGDAGAVTTHRVPTKSPSDSSRLPDHFVVQGHVLYESGGGPVKGIVRAFDRGLRSEKLLGEATTNGTGRYEITYRPEQIGRAEKKSVTLIIRAFSPDGALLGSSPPLFDVQPVETVDLLIGGKYRGPSEYEQLVQELTPLLQGLSFTELTEDDKHQDVTFLSGETGQDPGRITFLIAAHRLLRETDMPAEVFYGMFRQGLPTQLPALLAQSPDVHRRAIVRSAEANIMPPAFGAQADAIVERFKMVLVRQAMQQPPDGGNGTATLNDLLGVSLQDPRLREGFLSAYVIHTGPVEEFWKGLAARPEFKGHIESVQRTLQLGALTGNHLPLVHELRRMQQAGKIAALSDLARFDENSWLEVITKDSGGGPIGFPPRVPGKDNAEKARNYAKAMSHMVEDAFPTAFVTHRLETETHDLPGKDDLLTFFKANPKFDIRTTRLDSYVKEHPGALANIADLEETKTRLKAMQRVYKLAPRYEQMSALIKGGVDSAHRITRMGQNAFTRQYAHALGGTAPAGSIYWKAQEIESTAMTLLTDFGVKRVGLHAVPDEPVLEVEGVPEWSTLFGSLELCECEHCRSVYSPAAYLVDVLHFLNDRKLTDEVERDDAGRITKVTYKKRPYGTAGVTEVIGEAASAKDALFSRRPDLGEIELTCENTNTPLPYVDLVNEALENAVAPHPAFAPFDLRARAPQGQDFEVQLNSKAPTDEFRNAFTPPLSTEAVITVGAKGKSWDVDPDWWTIDEPAFTYTIRKENNQLQVVARSLQTKGSAAERAANPQYVNAKAYDDGLAKAVYPWSLPFSLWAEEARAYLGHLGVPRFRIMEAFEPGERAAILDGAALAHDYLGLTSAQADLITNAHTRPWELWGFVPPPNRSAPLLWLSTLSGSVKVFLERSGLQYKEMLDLLGTYYVNLPANGARSIKIVAHDDAPVDTCETDKLRLEGFDQGAAMRTVRFIRLWRTLGWSMRDLDRAITAFVPAGSNLDDDFLVRLSHVQRLYAALNVPVLRLLSWWAPIDADFYIDHSAPGQPRVASLYDQLFRNRTAVNPPDPAFTENPQDPNTGLKGMLSEHVPAVTAALGISAADFMLLFNDGNVIPRIPDPADPTNTIPDDKLNLDNLSRLHRHALLAKALRLPVRDYLTALKLIAANQFATTTDTLIFAETVDKVRGAGVTVAELDYLLRHGFTPESTIAPTDETIATFLNELRAGLQKIAEENTFRSGRRDPAEPEADFDPTEPTTDLNGDLTRQKLALLNWDRDWVDEAVATLSGTVVYKEPLAALPAGLTLPNTTGAYAVDLAALPVGFAIPVALRDVVAYDATNQKLTATRFLGQVERTLLKDAASAAGDVALTTAVDALFQQQDELQGEISYDAPHQMLQFTGPMTNLRLQRLLNVPNDAAHAAYRAAIQELYDKPRRVIRRAMRTFAVHDFGENLADLPTMVKIPAALKRKIYFDATASRLHCLGVMSEQERDTLLALSTDPADANHVTYQAAVRALYDKAEAVVPDTTDVFLTAAGVNNDAATLFDTAVAPGDRFLHVLKKLLPHLRRTLSEQLAVQKTAEALQLEMRSANALLREWLVSPVDPQRRCLAELLAPAFTESNINVQLTFTAFPAQFKTFLRVHKAALVAARFKLTHRQLGWIFEYGPTASWLDLNSLPSDAQDPAAPFDGWLRLADLAKLRDSLPQGEKALDELLASVRAAAAPGADKNAAKQEWFAALMRWTPWTQADLQTLLGAAVDHTETGVLNVSFPDDYRGEHLPLRLKEAFAMLKRLGISATQTVELATGDVTQPKARRVRQAVRAKYDEAQWLNLAKPLHDVLREKQRAALVAYLVAHHKLPATIRDANDLYAYFLIDVEMDSCMVTSRIKQAISSVQLFVQRCLMNLEPDVSASAEVDDRWREWKWMKNYRVWEANRKIFLYPENWIEPELRDDKSPFFKELESELLQSDLTQETVEEAFLHYLEKLDEVARLEIVAMYHQVETHNGQPDGNVFVDILHVFGRTSGTPHIYFYRQRIDSAYWTAWERLDLDIEGNHLIPVVWNRRLMLLWPIFTERADPLSVTFTGNSLSGMDPQKYWEIKLAWSERKQGGWISKKVSSTHIRVNQSLDVSDDRSNFFFQSGLDEKNNLIIRPGLDGPSAEDAFLGDEAFQFESCGSDPVVIVFETVEPLKRLTGTYFVHMWLREHLSEAGDKLYLPAPTTDTVALAKTPGAFLLLPYSDGSSMAEHPFFFQDHNRTFFVFPSKEQVPMWELPEAEKVAPDIVIDLSKYHGEEANAVPEPGPLINPEDPWISTPSFPVMPEAGVSRPSGGVILPADVGGHRTAGGAGLVSASGGLTAGGRLMGRGLTMRTMLGVGNRPTTPLMAPIVSGSGMPISGGGTSVGFGWYSYRPKIGFLFKTFYHPYVCAFVRELNRHGVDGLLQRPLQTHPHEFAPCKRDGQQLPPLDFKGDYDPQPIVLEPYPVESVAYDPNAPSGQRVVQRIVGLDFNEDGAYALYNWELFFHAPLLIADRLSKNQRYEEAQKWFHYIFDPTDASSIEVPQRYWRTKPFHERKAEGTEGYQRERIQYILDLLARGNNPQTRHLLSPDEKDDLDRFQKSVKRWRKDPFKPHLIARMRTTAYQKTVVMKYLDNLIAWGDQLFRRDTIESINEATQLYILAAEILGRRPEDVPPRAFPRVQTYNSLEPRLDDFSNALVQIEEFIAPSASSSAAAGSGQQSALTLSAMLYFCVPKNDKLLAYWDTVADRLFKIRHCMNIEGIVRQLPLFEPPIEPGLLVKAAAAGVDLSSVLNDLSPATPHYRFNVLAQKATEMCAELKSLGQAMLVVLEKRDAEQLGLLRAQHETTLLALVEQVRKLQYDEAEQNKTALSRSRDMVVSRFVHYQKLLGVQSPQVPGIGESIPEASPSAHIAIQEEGGIKMIPFETEEMELLGEANDWQLSAAQRDVAASVAHIIPNFNIEPWGVGPTFGGSNIGSFLSAFANYSRARATSISHEASQSAKLGQYALRAHDWLLQSNLAVREIMQIDQQHVAADLRSQIAAKELSNHKRQLDNAREVEEFLRDKYTNQELYGWMLSQLATVYFQTYQLAYDLAKRAERAFRHELGLQNSNYIQFGYWDSLKKGLLAGERLFNDLKRLEVAYLDQHKREYEITKHVSLRQLDPLALVQLRQTGACIMRLPEALFDLNYPGHYMRRIKSVSISIPCVTGPYTGVNCTLTLLKSSVRHGNTLLGGKNYARQEVDPRFTDSLGAIQSIVTSSGQNDSGLFETNLRDERFLPFEGAGAISEWQLELPAGFRQFDYDTISDVILHLRYTAREGGGLLRQQAALELQTALNEFIRSEGQQGLAQVFNLRHEFPTEWHRFLNPPAGAAAPRSFILNLGKERFPFLFANRGLTISAIELFIKVKDDFVDTHNENTLKLTLAAGVVAQPPDLLPLAPWNGLLRATKGFNHEPSMWTLNAWLDNGDPLDPTALENMVVVCHYSVGT